MNKMSKLMLIIFVIFLVWIIFIDTNSIINRQKLNSEIKELKKETDYYQSEIDKDKKMIKDLNNKDSLEKYAREKYKMKKENEEIFLIEFDTLK